jgi:hypothetical protein
MLPNNAVRGRDTDLWLRLAAFGSLLQYRLITQVSGPWLLAATG